MVQATGAPIAEYFAALDDPRIDRTKRHKLLDIVTIALCATICGADSWVVIERRRNHYHTPLQSSSATVKRSGSSPFWSCPTVSLPMIPSATSSPAWTQSSFNTGFHGVGPSRSPSHPRRSGGHRRQDGTALPRPYPGQVGRPFTWSTCGPRPMAWRWARPRWTRSPMKSPPSPSCYSCWSSPVASSPGRHGLPEGDSPGDH